MGAGGHVKAGTRLQDILPWLQRGKSAETVSVLIHSLFTDFRTPTTDFSKDVC